MSDTGFVRDLAPWRDGDTAARGRPCANAYGELKQIANRGLCALGCGDRVQTTMIVHECYLKLLACGAVDIESHTRFSRSARAMRQIIVDSARRQLAEKRGEGPALQVTLGSAAAESASPDALGPEAIAILDQALTDLDAREPRLVRIAECRVFGELSTAEFATASTSPSARSSASGCA